MSELKTKPAHKYKKGTTFVFFGLVLLVIVAVDRGPASAVLGLVGLVLLIVGIAQKSER